MTLATQSPLVPWYAVVQGSATWSHISRPMKAAIVLLIAAASALCALNHTLDRMLTFQLLASVPHVLLPLRTKRNWAEQNKKNASFLKIHVCMCVHTCVCLCVHLAQARGHQCHSITPHLIALTQDLSLGFTLLASLDGVGRSPSCLCSAPG